MKLIKETATHVMMEFDKRHPMIVTTLEDGIIRVYVEPNEISAHSLLIHHLQHKFNKRFQPADKKKVIETPGMIDIGMFGKSGKAKG